MDRITRTLTISTIHYSEAIIGEDGTPSLVQPPAEIVNGAVSKEKAQALLLKKYGADKTFLVTSIEAESKKYSMPLDQFLALAEIIEEKNTTQGNSSLDGAADGVSDAQESDETTGDSNVAYHSRDKPDNNEIGSDCSDTGRINSAFDDENALKTAPSFNTDNCHVEYHSRDKPV